MLIMTAISNDMQRVSKPASWVAKQTYFGRASLLAPEKKLSESIHGAKTWRLSGGVPVADSFTCIFATKCNSYPSLSPPPSNMGCRCVSVFSIRWTSFSIALSSWNSGRCHIPHTKSTLQRKRGCLLSWVCQLISLPGSTYSETSDLGTVLCDSSA